VVSSEWSVVSVGQAGIMFRLDLTIYNSQLIARNHRAYSYGDSAGFTPDFPFNPEHSGTNYGAKVINQLPKKFENLKI
jgi:hypothetical protein